MQIKPFSALAIATFVAAWTPAVAQPAPHAAHHQAAPTPALPAEPGNAAFAAISEIVTLLMNDPRTDWSRVDIAALRAHLADMHHLMLDTRVETEPLETGLRMRISLDAALRMVPAHAAVLEAETGWSSGLSMTRDAIVWTVNAEDEQEVTRIAALGFYGLMATGDHHRAHHLALARGAPIH